MDHTMQWIWAYEFLSLDYISPWWNQLGLKFVDEKIVKNIVREELKIISKMGPGYSREFVGFCPILKHNVNERLNAFSPEILFQFNWWIQNIYCFESHIRRQAFTWGILMHDLSSDQQFIQDAQSIIVEKTNLFLVKVRQKDNKIEKEVVNSTICISEWDQFILRSKNTSLDVIQDELENIVNHNVFVELWDEEFRNFNLENLEALYIHARRLLRKKKKRDILSFPGDWKYELIQYYKKQ
jgi:hypothetical protein